MTDINAICVFCASSNNVDPKFRNDAAAFGRICAEAGIKVVFGGGRVGLMGALADAAMDAGGEVIGIIPQFLDHVEIAHRETTEVIFTDGMHERKAQMNALSDAFVALPGGIGTLEETFEVLSWKQLERHHKPIVLANIDGFWQPMIDLLDHMTEQRFVRPEHRALITVVERIEDILPAVATHD
jgi:uncharacterized protein (TIGR00730 family)